MNDPRNPSLNRPDMPGVTPPRSEPRIYEQAECPLCGEIVYNSAAAWKGHFALNHLEAAHPTAASTDAPLACGHCGYAGTDETGDPIFLAATPPSDGGLDVERLVLAHYNTPRTHIGETAREHLVRVVAEYARLSSPEGQDR